MTVSPEIEKTMESSSFIRKMFEDGIRLRKILGEDKVYDFSLGNPDLDVPEELKAIIKEVADDDTKGCHGYMTNAGYPFCREAIGEKISLEQGVSVSGEFVVMASGAAGAMNVLLKAVLVPGDRILVPSPYFSEYTHYVANHGGRLVPVETNPDFSLNLENIRNAFTGNTRGIIINSPNNPTGRIYTEEELIALRSLLYELGKKNGDIPFVIADEPYRDILYDGAVVPSVFKIFEKSVIVSSFAKNLSIPGERIGYVAVNPLCPDGKELAGACGFTTRILGFVNAPAFFQRVIAKGWNVKADYSSYAERCSLLKEVLDSAGIEYFNPQGAFYLFCPVPAKNESSGNCESSQAFCCVLKKYGILAVPGVGFGREGYIRLAFCVSPDTIKNSKESFKMAVEDWKQIKL